MIGVNKELCQKIIEQYEPSDDGKANHFMTVDGERHHSAELCR
jgi:hypothetical protein